MIPPLLFLHVASAVALTGELLFASLWFRAALARGGGPAVTRYALGTMAWTSKSVALPFILLNLLTGLALIHFNRFSLIGTRWILISLALYVILTGLWHGLLIPTRKRMQALVESVPAAGYASEDRETSVEFSGLARKWISMSGVAIALLFAILLLMVWKPSF